MGGYRMDVNKELKFLWIHFFFFLGGGGGGLGRCEQRSGVFVKIQKKNFGGVGGGWG